MIQIRRKKEKPKGQALGSIKESPKKESGGTYVGAFPGKPWERLTERFHRRGSRLLTLSDEEQREVVELARRFFGCVNDDFPRARIAIQTALDAPTEKAARHFFEVTLFPEKRLVVRAYLTNASGRFIEHENALALLTHIANAGLDFEVGAIDHVIDTELRTELIVGDGTEVISATGYWFAHTHPARAGVTENILPSTQDIDVMVLTAHAWAQHGHRWETEYYVLRDIGGTRVRIETNKPEGPAPATIEGVAIAYWFDGDDASAVDRHRRALEAHLRMRHHITADQLTVRRESSRESISP